MKFHAAGGNVSLIGVPKSTRTMPPESASAGRARADLEIEVLAAEHRRHRRMRPHPLRRKIMFVFGTADSRPFTTDDLWCRFAFHRNARTHALER